MTVYAHSSCLICGEHSYVTPLHGDRGGPQCCLLCAGKWAAEHNPRRKARRFLIKAIKAYEAAGGSLFSKDFDQLRLVATGIFGGKSDSTDFNDLTSELLTATLALTHPDKHPPDRKAEANRVTQELLVLKPFVFPAPEPEPSEPPPSDTSAKQLSDDLNNRQGGAASPHDHAQIPIPEM